MAEYIKKEDALAREYLGYTRCSETDWQKGYWAGVDDICHHVKSLTAADVVEVAHSEWAIIEFNKEEGLVTVECKNCGAAFTIEMPDYGLSYNFCPSCGAEMSGERRSE